jgi:hexosaminidase
MMRGGAALTMGAAMILSGCDRGPEHTIVPIPREISVQRGAFLLDAATSVVLADPTDAEARRVAELWAEPLRAGSGLSLTIEDGGDIRLGVDGTGEPESYRLDVTSDGVTVTGSDPAGLWYGLQTLNQLLPSAAGRREIPAEGVEVQAVQISDAPRFAYRGMHLDVARHFYGPEFVKHYIDLLAMYKINRFHWHLTEDQGWRIEIDAYPRLTEIGAYRDQTHIGHGREEFNGDGQRYGGFYTKDEVRDIVAYAAERFVTIIPEIEMPGHSQAALAAYPELGCTEGPFEVAMSWGVFEDIYCPHETTFEFLETVLAEVIELFPGEYVHIGGDEAPKTRWEESDFVQALMQREGLVDEHAVQSWFIRRIEDFFNDNGKRMIGWDEILEGGLAPNATVMSWRGTIGGIEASRMGHDVVMTPYSHLYLDYYQSEDQENEPFAIGGFLPLDTVYSYEPVPEQLRAADAAHIIGVQANVWTEYMKTGEHVEYMLFPRMFALSEIAWSPKESKNYEGFLERLGWHFSRLDAMGVNYRPLDDE